VKNNIKNIIAVIVTVLCLNNTCAFAEVNSGAAPLLKITIAKFVLVMIGLFAFSLILYVGLSVYNKFFVDSKIKDYKLRKDSLRTPIDKEEAVMMFITKNRLK